MMETLKIAPAGGRAEQVALLDPACVGPAHGKVLLDAHVSAYATDSASEPGAMSVGELAKCCRREIKDYRRGEVCDNRSNLELFRRATLLHDRLAWEAVQECCGEVV